MKEAAERKGHTGLPEKKDGVERTKERRTT